MKVVKLNNNGPVKTISDIDLYFPRLQVNNKGEIVLATSKKGSLTTGILVGRLPKCKTKTPIGKKFDDWEVAGELVDYDGKVSITLENESKAKANRFTTPKKRSISKWKKEIPKVSGWFWIKYVVNKRTVICPCEVIRFDDAQKKSSIPKGSVMVRTLCFHTFRNFLKIGMDKLCREGVRPDNSVRFGESLYYEG